MAAPYTPTVTVEAGFGNSPTDGVITWASLAAYRPHDVKISRGRPSEFDRFKPATCSLRLVDTTSRDLDPTNLSGPFVETTVTTESPLYVGTLASEVGTSLGTNNAFTLPTGVVAGELLLAYVTVDLNGGAGAIATGTGSAVWAELFDDANGTIVRHALYARIATGSDALVLTGPTEDYVVEIIRVGKHGCATTADVQVGTTATGTSGTPNPPLLTPVGGAVKWLWIGMAGVDFSNTGDLIDTFPTGMTTIDIKQSAVSTTAVEMAWAYHSEEVASYNPLNWGVNASRAWVANTIAIPPESTSVDRTQVTPNTPIRVVGSLAAADNVLDDQALGPELHSAWRVETGAITDAIAGAYILPTGLVMTGPAFNFDGPSSFQYGTFVDGATPNHDVRIVLGNGGHIGWNLTGTTLTYHVFDGGSTADDTVVWNDTNHRYLRVRFDGDDVVWERSSDASSWTTINTYTRGSDFSSTVDWSYGHLYVANNGATSPSLYHFKVDVSHFTRFRGTVDSWGYQPLGGNRGALVDVQATDAFKAFANQPLRSAWAYEMVAQAPDVWYPLGDADGSRAADVAGGELHGTILPLVVEQGVAPVRPWLSGGATRFPPRTRVPGIRLPDAARITSAPYTMNLWVQASEVLPNQGLTVLGNTVAMALFEQGNNGDGYEAGLYIQASVIDSADVDNPIITYWAVGLDTLAPSPSLLSAHWLAPVEDTLPHMVTVAYTSTTVFICWVDGVQRTLQDSTTVGYSHSMVGQYIGRSNVPATVASTVSYPGAVDEFAVFSRALAEADVLALYAAATNPWDGDTTGQRVHRVLDLIGWPDELRRVDQGTVTLGPATIEGTSVLGHLQAVEQTEGGRLFIGPNGEVVFHDALRVVTRTTSPVLFDDAASGVNILGDGFEVTHDESFLFTTAQVSRAGGGEQSYQDDTAVARFGARGWSGTVLARTDVEALMRAVGVVERYKEPQPRLGSWHTAPEKQPADWGPVLDVRLGDSVQVQFQLLDTGDSFDGYLEVASSTETIGRGAWEFEYMGNPMDPAIGSFFQFDGTSDTGFNYGVWR